MWDKCQVKTVSRGAPARMVERNIPKRRGNISQNKVNIRKYFSKEIFTKARKIFLKAKKIFPKAKKIFPKARDLFFKSKEIFSLKAKLLMLQF